MARSAELAILVAPDRERLTVAPQGELDCSNTPALRTTLWEHVGDGWSALELDLSRLEFIDTSGLHLVVDLVHHCERQGIELAVVPGPYAVRRAFELSGLEPHVPFANGNGRRR